MLALVLMCLTDHPVLPSYHRRLDTYATYVISLSKGSLHAVSNAVKAANQRWDAATD